MFFSSPLEQFEILVLKPFLLFHFFDLSFTNATLFLFLAFGLLLFFFLASLLFPFVVPSKFLFLLLSSYSFVLGIVKQQAGNRGLVFFPLFYALFLLILFSNLIGLLPFAFTPTSHLAFTLTLAFSCNLALIFIGFYLHSFSFLMLFVPKGSPAWLLPLIVVIEFFSYLIRTLSLSIRLFANMMAGHTLLHILSSFIVPLLTSGHLFIGFLPFILVVAVLALEFGIAFLQAYVFVVLLSIYLHDSFHPIH
jgi:F-type H+-transporting ATPase subunit a